MSTAPRQRTSPEGLKGLEGWNIEELQSIWGKLDQSQREYIRLYYDRVRKYNKEATESWNRRQRRLEYLLDYCRVNKYNDFQQREKITSDWVYNDSHDDWMRFSREVRRCIVAIDTELKMASLFSMEAKSAE